MNKQEKKGEDGIKRAGGGNKSSQGQDAFMSLTMVCGLLTALGYLCVVWLTSPGEICKRSLKLSHHSDGNGNS